MSTHHHAILSQRLPLRMHPVWRHMLPLPRHHLLLLLFALSRQPLLLHVLLHRNTDGARGALALLVMLQQLTRSNTPAGVGHKQSCRAFHLLMMRVLACCAVLLVPV